MFFTYKCTPLLLRTHNMYTGATYSKYVSVPMVHTLHVIRYQYA